MGQNVLPNTQKVKPTDIDAQESVALVYGIIADEYGTYPDGHKEYKSCGIVPGGHINTMGKLVQALVKYVDTEGATFGYVLFGSFMNVQKQDLTGARIFVAGPEAGNLEKCIRKQFGNKPSEITIVDIPAGQDAKPSVPTVIAHIEQKETRPSAQVIELFPK